MMLLGYLYGVSSERRLAEEISVNLAYMWYLGYDIDEETPNHSVISKARARYGKEVVEEFFNRILGRCIEEGLVKYDTVYVDSTLIKANASTKSIVPRKDCIELKSSPKEYIEKVFQENTEDRKSDVNNSDIDSPKQKGICNSKKYSETEAYRSKNISNKDYVSKKDPDASFIGRPNVKGKLTYKEHKAIHKAARVIPAVEVTTGSVDDGQVLKKLIDKQDKKPDEVCGDSKYGTAENYEYL